MPSERERQAVVEFLHREARLADEARYAEWLGLWTDDGVYWVPATTDPAADPEQHLSHIYDHRPRIETRVRMLETARLEMHWWIGRTTHRLRPVDGTLRMCAKKVVLVNAAEPLPNLTFLL